MARRLVQLLGAVQQRGHACQPRSVCWLGGGLLFESGGGQGGVGERVPLGQGVPAWP